ncbi:MAG: 30S ribosomal protein S1 [Candidatus Aminicenantes bacterium 4484_214]|nr:MAG: 30S ribosomal protein S1 [Candidatus Aminicenantes bacterium 4484_214]
MSELTKNLSQKDQFSSEEYEQLLDQYQFSTKELTQGKIVKGRIVKITENQAIIDIGFKSEGIIPLEEFKNELEPFPPTPGAEVEAMIIRTSTSEGYIYLSKKRADEEKALNHLEKVFHHNSWIEGKIVEKIKNGYRVDVGIATFLPDSHADVRKVRYPEKLIGQTFKFKILRFDRKTSNAVLSRKLYLLDEKERRKARVFSQLEKGKKIKGKVKGLTSFGAFIDLGGVEGLLHISDMTWGRIRHPNEVLKVGEEIEVMVLDFDERQEKISLGLKQLVPDPWSNIEAKYQVGQKVKGKVVSLTDFGAFIELEEGVEGLVHVSDLTWSRKTIHPKKILSLGQEVTVSILDINPKDKRISLGLKQTTLHPLETLRQKLGTGSKIKGKITSITDFGAFIEVEKGIEGLVHISDISWQKIKHPGEKLKVGQEVEAIILNIDVEKQKLSLGIKQLEGDIWEDFFNRHKIGDLVNVKIVRKANFGVFVEITPGIEGVVFLSELSDQRIENPEEAFKIGEEKMAKIIKLNPQEKKISLSFRQAQQEIQKMEYQKYRQSQPDRLTFGDLIREQLKNINTSNTSKEKNKKKEGQ